MHILVWNSFHS